MKSKFPALGLHTQTPYVPKHLQFMQLGKI